MNKCNSCGRETEGSAVCRACIEAKAFNFFVKRGQVRVAPNIPTGLQPDTQVCLVIKKIEAAILGVKSTKYEYDLVESTLSCAFCVNDTNRCDGCYLVITSGNKCGHYFSEYYAARSDDERVAVLNKWMVALRDHLKTLEVSK